MLGNTAETEGPVEPTVRRGLARRHFLAGAGVTAGAVAVDSLITTSPAGAAIASSLPTFSTNAILTGSSQDGPYTRYNPTGASWTDVLGIPPSDPAAFGRATSPFGADVSSRSDGSYGLATYGTGGFVGAPTGVQASGQVLIADNVGSAAGQWHAFPIAEGAIAVQYQTGNSTNWVALARTNTQAAIKPNGVAGNYVYSTIDNGVRWSGHTLPGTDPDPYCLTHSNSKWIIGGQTGLESSSATAVVWTSTSTPPTASANWSSAITIRARNTGTTGGYDTWVTSVRHDTSTTGTGANWYATVVETKAAVGTVNGASSGWFNNFRSWVYRSTDNGATWSIWQGGATGFDNVKLESIDIDPSNGTVVAVGGPAMLLVGNKSNGANTWTSTGNNQDVPATNWAGFTGANRWWKDVRCTGVNRFVAVGDILSSGGVDGGLLWYSISGGTRWSTVANPGDDLRAVDSPSPAGTAFTPRSTVWAIQNRTYQDGTIALSSGSASAAATIYQQTAQTNGIPTWSSTGQAINGTKGVNSGAVALNDVGDVAAVGQRTDSTNTTVYWANVSGGTLTSTSNTYSTTQDSPAVAIGSVAGSAPVRPFVGLVNKTSPEGFFNTRADASNLGSGAFSKSGYAYTLRTVRWGNGMFLACGREFDNTDEAEIWMVPRASGAFDTTGNWDGFRYFNPRDYDTNAAYIEDAAYAGSSVWYAVDNYEWVWKFDPSKSSNQWRRIIRVTSGANWERMRIAYCPQADRLIILLVSGGDTNQIRYINNMSTFTVPSGSNDAAPTIWNTAALYNANCPQAYNGVIKSGNELNWITRAAPRQFVAVGKNGQYLYSYDSGASWFPGTISGAGNLLSCAGEQVW